jgi:hypothetical protein
MPKDEYVGLHGGTAYARSEGQVLRAVIAELSAMRGRGCCRELGAIIGNLRALERQVGEGYHKNPALVIYGNPPFPARLRQYDPSAPIQVVSEVSVEVHALAYKHARDGKLYQHDFEEPTSMLAVLRHGRHDVLLSSPDGNPIWQEF